MRIAVPYARHCVTVIAPDGFVLPSMVYSESNRRGIKINILPHSYFPKEQLRRAAKQYMMAPVDKDGVKFPAYAERLLGEKESLNSHLIPRSLLHFAMDEF